MGALSTDAESQIKALVQQREQARANKDFTRSDEIREELKTMGVEVFDKEKMWRSTSGASGVILGYHARGGPTDLEITTLVVQREKVRQSGDFGTSDMIRNELRAVGVEIYDKEKIWKASDGRQGPVPTWQQVQAVCNTEGPLLLHPLLVERTTPLLLLLLSMAEMPLLVHLLPGDRKRARTGGAGNIALGAIVHLLAR